MLDGINGRIHRCVLVDLNTQRDFFDPTGACPVLNTIGIHACLRRVVAWAKRNQVPIISSVESHRRHDALGFARRVHCIEGSPGYHKLPFTLLPSRVFVPGDNTLCVATDLFRRHQQVIFPQRSEDLFANPKADRFLTQLRAEEFVVYGATAEHEVKAVALGLIARHKKVAVVTDVCGCWNPTESDLSLRLLAAKGARLMTVEELIQRRLPRRGRYTSAGLIYPWPARPAPALRSNGNGRRRRSRR